MAPHIAWEPNAGLGAVRDDMYLRKFARDCARAQCPIFIGFASEMNGDWTRYGGDSNATENVGKWRLVRRVLAGIAPNVAFIWCVNATPQANIPRFYPGEEFIDWVGIYFYTVLFRDNDRRRSALHENPADELAHLVGLYGKEHPIAICEFGVSQCAAVDRVNRSDWASDKLHALYASLPRLWPQVKLVDIFNMDNMKHAQPGRRLNNFRVTDGTTKLDTYSDAVRDPWFHSRVGDKSPDSAPFMLDKNPTRVSRGRLELSVWSRCWSERHTVRYTVAGVSVMPRRERGARAIVAELRASGPVTVGAEVIDSRGKVAARTEHRIVVG